MVYSKFISKDIKVSLAIIPNSIKSCNRGSFEDFHQIKNSANYIHKNVELYDFIDSLVKKNKIEVMLHGYNHNYYVKHKNQFYFPSKEQMIKLKKNSSNFKFIGEFNYPDYELLCKKMKKGKEYLEDIFETKIYNFVPPSNQINSYGIKALNRNKLNLSGIVGRNYNREKNLKGYISYIKRWGYRVKNKGIYPEILNYGKHKELAAFSITPTTDFIKLDSLIKEFQKNTTTLQFATHYWELKGELRENFIKAVNQISKTHKSAFLKDYLK